MSLSYNINILPTIRKTPTFVHLAFSVTAPTLFDVLAQHDQTFLEAPT